MAYDKIGLAGSGVLLAGLFAPVFTLPIIGPANFIGTNSELVSLSLVALCGVGIFSGARNQVEHLFGVGLGALLILAASFGSAQLRHYQIKSQLEEKLSSNPYSADVLSDFSAPPIEWGWLALVAGAALITYAAIAKRKARIELSVGATEGREKLYNLGSAVPVTITLAIIGIGHLNSKSEHGSFADATGALVERKATEVAASAEASAFEKEKQDYIANHMEIYELDTRYMDSLLDGRIPGVNFKLRNRGKRTLSEVQVMVQFFDAEGNAVAEEVYYPVLAGGFDSDTPLRPGYIWQNERGRFYSAKAVPSEWQSGRAKAFVSDIEFADIN